MKKVEAMKLATGLALTNPNLNLDYLKDKFKKNYLKDAEKHWEDSYTLRSHSLATLLGYSSEEDFELEGQRDAQYLCSFVASNSIVLDLGCGVGRVTSYLAPYCREIHGVDVSSIALKFAQERCQSYPNIFFHKGNGFDLSCFDDQYFDFVCALNIFMHLDVEPAICYLREIHRVLKQNGRFVFDIPNFLHEVNLKALFSTAPKPWDWPSSARTRYWTPQMAEIIVTRLAFRIEKLVADEEVTVVASKERT